jgi:hypothetical protein
LNQAENDKQTYETARKVYEEEAAARARGELVDPKTDPTAEASTVVPPIPIAAHTPATQTMIDVNDHVLPPPTPVNENETPRVTETPDFAQFTNDSDEDKKPVPSTFDTSLDDFQGFPDPLGDMGFAGLEPTPDQSNQEWDDLHNLMGEQTSAKSEEADDVDVAPTMEEAVAETGELASEPLATDEGDIQQVAVEAEGAMGVPDVPGEGSGVPTEAVNEMPADQEVSAEAQVQGEGQEGLSNGESVLDVPASPPAEFQ